MCCSFINGKVIFFKYLNIFSHEAALEYAKKAVLEINSDFLYYIKNKDIDNLRSDTEFIEKATSLAISFHNVGVENEFF